MSDGTINYIESSDSIRIMASAKPGQKIQIDKVKATSEELERLPEKPKEELSLRESIYFLRDKLRSALKKGYSYQDLSELLEQQEILISAATLKQYLTEIEKEATKGKRSAKSVKASQPSPPNRSPESMAVTPETSVKESSEKPSGDLPESVAEISETTVNKSSETSSADLEQADSQEQEEQDIRDVRESQSKPSKSVRRKTRGGSKVSTDLSSEFNQY